MPDKPALGVPLWQRIFYSSILVHPKFLVDFEVSFALSGFVLLMAKAGENRMLDWIVGHVKSEL